MLSFPGLPQSNTHQIPAVAQQQPKYEAPIPREAVVPLWSWRLQAVFGRYVGGIIQQHSPGKYKYVLKVQQLTDSFYVEVLPVWHVKLAVAVRGLQGSTREGNTGHRVE